jgi:hypothetical protein
MKTEYQIRDSPATRKFADEPVAQVSNLLYRRFLIGRATRSGLETRDTADGKSALPTFGKEP